jgi:mRNA interferase HigB
MRVIKKTTLLEYSKTHAKAERPLWRWHEITSRAQWEDFDEVRAYFPHADMVRVASHRPVVVFNIGGNDYRLVAAIHYNKQVVYVLRIMTHAEYDKGEWKKQL